MDLRRIRVGIEVAGRLQWYEGLRIKANGTKYANPLQNECTVSIDGLNAHTRDYLLTETSPYHKSKQTRRLYLEVGRVNTGLFRIFTGDIVSAEIASPPDVTLIIKAKTNNASSGDIVSSSGGAMQKMSEIASSVAKDCKVRLTFKPPIRILPIGIFAVQRYNKYNDCRKQETLKRLLMMIRCLSKMITKP